MGLFALERLRADGATRARECAGLVVDRLEELARETPDGLTWHTPARLLLPSTRARHPEGYLNLGMAHGIPAVLVIVALFRAHGVEAARCHHMLDRGLAWLRSKRNPDSELSRFGHQVGEAQRDRTSRLGWCYGDLGIAAALLWAARVGGDGAIERALTEEARLCADRAFLRRPADCDVRDAGICHGSAGLALLHARLYNATGDLRHRVQSRFWYRETLEFRRPGCGIAGYQAPVSRLAPDGSMRTERAGSPGLLIGAAGIGRSLLAGATEIEPAWDRMLLSAVPPR